MSIGKRQLEIAIKASEGLTSKQIAGDLGISPRTVDNALAHVYEKLEISSRKQLQYHLAQKGYI